ncbi:hypothetical protein [Frondihabitans sp. Leaf304]|uniref:hypothetical protein n=1 Tax=Frondihabitans sp. Leaf304 TaxID=1736329 RepID=UPI0006F81143|nr:hypothetical protein [Frondihabitans sp. Leaf304]KQQ27960.1 hypothetical protein ASF54_04310 [Frondihabitans sp. Leaf304]
MTTPTTRQNVPARPDAAASARRPYAIFTGLAVLFIFLQSITAGNFIEDGLSESAKTVWTDIHGGFAYPIMVFSLVAAVIALTRLADAGALRFAALALFVLTVAQWLTGHAISGLGMDWITPFHVALAFVIYGLAIWLSIRSAALRRIAA